MAGKHGHSPRSGDSPEYNSWRGMKERCTNPNHIGFEKYGGAGVTVCERWCDDFAAFLADMGPKPTPEHSIDRYPNPDGNYEPDNCRWATPAQQRANQRPHDESYRVQRSWDTGKRSRVSKGRVDMTGQVFGRLTVVGPAETADDRARWLCQCTCGADPIVTGKSLRNGSTTSCGCYTRELARQRAIIRNRTNNPAIARWQK